MKARGDTLCICKSYYSTFFLVFSRLAYVKNPVSFVTDPIDLRTVALRPRSKINLLVWRKCRYLKLHYANKKGDWNESLRTNEQQYINRFCAFPKNRIPITFGMSTTLSASLTHVSSRSLERRIIFNYQGHRMMPSPIVFLQKTPTVNGKKTATVKWRESRSRPSVYFRTFLCQSEIIIRFLIPFF